MNHHILRWGGNPSLLARSQFQRLTHLYGASPRSCLTTREEAPWGGRDREEAGESSLVPLVVPLGGWGFWDVASPSRASPGTAAGAGMSVHGRR